MQTELHRVKPAKTKETMHKLAVILLCAASIQAAAQDSPSNPVVSIKVDLAKPQGVYTPIYRWFGYDESNYTTMKYGKELLRELHDLSPVPVYIRAHHLFTSGNGVPELKWSSSNVFSLDANGKPVYDFTITDQTFDSYKSAGVRPMVELGFYAQGSRVRGYWNHRVPASLSEADDGRLRQ
jgi:xylan 1,4-beta-xylosidase